ncbi:MAG TPA: tRNA preQ1(34) S-adenosylmethionine ribosyltransferase-isomerase QueA [Nitrospira sp.]|nr:tRNA preQ1(34) S-adenosylmethionine ribosyltransferase-isomerase QueA [Nitrospira sp.]
MQLSEFDFPFDQTLIATEPVLPRDRARLLLLDRSSGSLTHRTIADLPDLLTPGDLLVVNDTRVRPARVAGIKRLSGVKIELLFVKERSDGSWDVLVKGKQKPGQVIDVSPVDRVVIQSQEQGSTVVKIESHLSIGQFFDRFGLMPLPPYIKRTPSKKDHEWYQTVFATKEGAIAAPTAGLHFTDDLLDRLRQRDIGLAKVTLHVGVGTFKPVTAERVEDHRMGAEWLRIDMDTVRAIEQTRTAGGKIIAVGTTVVRALEAACVRDGTLRPYEGETRLFITPGHVFRTVDALITNFHLPKTTLLMLVSAFAGTAVLKRAYEEAVKERYRFYSYGDAMLIL